MGNSSRIIVNTRDPALIRFESSADNCRFEVEMLNLDSSEETEVRRALNKLRRLKAGVNEAEALMEARLGVLFLEKNMKLF